MELKDELCHHPAGDSWCTRRTGHRKPHRYEPRPITDEELMRRVYTMWAAIHPGSTRRMGWVIPEDVRDRFRHMATLNASPTYMHNPGFLPQSMPHDLLLGRPVRVGGTSILLEVIR